MQQFDITVPAAGTFPVHAAGRYIKYVSGNNGGGDCSLIVVPGAGVGGKVVLQPGQAYHVAPNKPTPDSWVLQNAAGGATILGKVVIGDGRIDDNTFSGVVQTVDGGKTRTLSNSAFSGFTLGTTDATHYCQIQLWNPAGSGVRAVIEFMSMFNNTASNGYLSDSTVALTNLIQMGQPKLLGGTQSVAQLRGGQTATAPGAPDNGSFSIVGGQSQLWAPKEPVIVPPGHGLLVTCNVVNTGLTGNFEWYEEPNV
jgi:hypothetical protein